jgi:hypothetical protein
MDSIAPDIIAAADSISVDLGNSDRRDRKNSGRQG